MGYTFNSSMDTGEKSMIITAICPECGDIIEEQECESHPDTALLIYESENEAFVGEALIEYIYG